MVEQGSDEWKAMRLGKATASRIADIVRKTKSGPSASRKNYAAELVVERLTGAPQDGFTSAAMQWGKDHEQAARDLYSFIMDCEVEQIAFVDHPTIPMAGASPDGLVSGGGLVEIKCPNTATHIATLLGADIDPDYVVQMQWQMACKNRDWCDFVSYDPRLPENMQMHIRRVIRDDLQIAELEKEVSIFLAEVDETVAQLRAKFEVKEAA
jgi:putative phage-type endonuclease